MKLQRTTWILLATAMSLSGVVYWAEIQGVLGREAAREHHQRLFQFVEDQVEVIAIARSGQTLRFERTGKEQHPWQMKQPDNVPASEPSIMFLLNLFVEGKRDRTFTIPRDRLAEYGLERPLAEITLEIKAPKQRHKLILGKPNFDEKFLYARVDPPSESEKQLEIVLVPIDFKYAIERDLKEWKEGDVKDQALPK